MLIQNFSQSIKSRTVWAFVVLACITISSLAFSPKMHAVSASDFNAGRIIDDAIFTNSDTMDVSSIQTFLNSKVPTCDTNGTQRSEMNNTNVPDYNSDGVIQRWEWGKYNYNQTSFPCLRDYVDNGVKSAQIIYNAAQQYHINPQVLIVLLQKEQGLVTDTWPLAVQYRTATGYGCPDTAACDSTYYGLTNQINWAAKMYRAILNQSSTWYSPYVLGNNYIQWNPTSSCGGSTVYIENLSTVALYDYTPYRPNQASLDAGYGGPVPCGAYGNRNFFLYFSDWFGSTHLADYHWQPISQASYTDSSQATPADLNQLVASNRQRVFLTVKVKNDSIATWYRGTVNLGTSGPQDRTSSIYDSTWLSPARPATLNEASVGPGEYGTFSFWANTPANAGYYKEYFNVVADGVTWMNDMGLYFGFNVQPVQYTWQPISQQAFTDSSKQTPANLSSMVSGDTAYMSVTVKNTGNITWRQNAINFGTAGSYDRASSVRTNEWLSSNRAATLKEQTVTPGGTGTFEFPVRIPAAGTYKEYFDLVAEGVTWMNDIGFYYQYNAAPATYAWQPVTQNAYTDSTKAVAVDTSQLSPGQRVFLEITAKNVGNTTWKQGNLNLGTSSPQNRSSVYYDPTWMSTNRPATLKEPSVSPGQIGTFDFWVTAPGRAGSTKEYFNFVAEYTTWLNDLGLYYPMTVK